MSNLYKSSWVVFPDEEPRVIDTNALMEQKMEEAAKKIEEESRTVSLPENEEADSDGFSSGLNAEQVDALTAEPNDQQVNALNEEYSNLMKSVANAKEEYEKTMAEVAGMKNAAALEIDQMKAAAIAEGRNSGYEDGKRKALEEIEAVKKEYEDYKLQLENQYDEMVEELEPKFVDTLTEIYEHVLGVDLTNQSKIVAYLLTRTMSQIEGAREFMVHVSKDDYPDIEAGKDQILKESGCANYHVEFIEDMVLGPGDCTIETENGIFDCSVGTNLKGLRQKLTELSFEKK